MAKCFEMLCYRCFHKDFCNKDYENPMQKSPSYMAGTKLRFRDKEEAEKALRPPRRDSYATQTKEQLNNATYRIRSRWGIDDDW